MIRTSMFERTAWATTALIGGAIVGWMDLSAKEVQGPVALLMIVAFALTLPGRAPAWLIAAASALGIPLAHAVAQGNFRAGYLLAFIPALVAAGGGYAAGLLLDTAASTLEEPANGSAASSPRPLSRRFILGVALVLIASVGFPVVRVMLRSLEHSAATWLAIIWQIMTLLGWVGLSPIILHLRPSSDADATETTAGEAVVQLVAATLLVVVHAAVIVLLTAMLAVPVVPTWRSMMLAAFAAYAPLDWLAYLAIITLGYVSDVERRRRVAVKREEALQAESLESRLSALRARLNPHFLFNALNSIHVLSSAGRTHETTRMVEGLTSLLRYVLDERRAKVPLSDEMAFAQEYLEVQRIRLGDRLQFEIETDPLAANTLVPQLVLQPIIENAVEHGIAQLLNGGTVRIGARIVHDRLEIDVENDGLGTDSRESTAGIGLSSTRERLARLYGASAIVSLEQRPSPPGVRARITIPVRHEAAA